MTLGRGGGGGAAAEEEGGKRRYHVHIAADRIEVRDNSDNSAIS